MNKTINVNMAGQGMAENIVVDENTTAADVLRMAKAPADAELLPGSGQPAFGKDERVFGRVKDGGKVVMAIPAVAGAC